MEKKPLGIEVVGYGLALIYSFFLTLSLESYGLGYFEKNMQMVNLMFGMLLINSIAVGRLQPRSRIVVVSVNVMIGFCLLQPYLQLNLYLPVSSILLLLLLFLFLSDWRFNHYFRRKGPKTWQSILIIDDDELLVKTVRPILINQGYSVLAALTGENGLQIAQTQKPDLILLDVILPGIKGRDVCRQLKEDKKTADIPVIFLTAKESADDVKAEMAVGGERHITKPVNPKEILSTVEEVLAVRKRK